MAKVQSAKLSTVGSTPTLPSKKLFYFDTGKNVPGIWLGIAKLISPEKTEISNNGPRWYVNNSFDFHMLLRDTVNTITFL